jgi:hypothetical protein
MFGLMGKLKRKFNEVKQKYADERGLQVEQLGTYALAAVIAFVLLSVGVTILSDLQSQQTGAGSFALGNALQFFTNMFSQFGLAGTIVGYAIVIGALALIGVGAYMGYKRMQ